LAGFILKNGILHFRLEMYNVKNNDAILLSPSTFQISRKLFLSEQYLI
jgi:hypothetical protein